MRFRWKPRLTYANVVSSIALFVALGGGAYATHSHLITTQDLRNQAVTTQKLRNGAVTPQKLRNQAVRPIKLARNAVFPGHIRNNAVRPAKIAPGAVFTTRLADGAVTGEKIGPEAVGTEKIGSGAVTSEKLGSESVTGSKIASGAVGTEKLDPGIHGVALAGAKVVGSNVTAWFNRFGGTPTVQNPSAGVRILTFPGLTGALGGNNVIHMATLRGSARGLINARNVGGNPEVRTWNIDATGNNNLANRGFNYVVFGTMSGPSSP